MEISKKELQAIENVDYFFTDEFISKYKDDTARMRQVIIDYMTKEEWRFRSQNFSYYNMTLHHENCYNHNYAKEVRRLHKDIKKLKEFVKIGVLTNKDLQNCKKHNQRQMLGNVGARIKDKTKDIADNISYNSEKYLGIALLVLSAMGTTHLLGSAYVRRGWINDSKEQISENICDDLNWSTFKYQAIDVVQDQNEYYVQVYGVVIQDAVAAPTLMKVNYKIDKEMYEFINKKFETEYGYNEDLRISQIQNQKKNGLFGISMRKENKLFNELKALMEEQVPYSYVDITNSNEVIVDNNYNNVYEEQIER